MKTYIQIKSFGIVSIVFCFALLAYKASAQTQQYWDNNGTSAVTSGTWDTTTTNWTSSATLSGSTVTYTNGNFAIFSAGNTTNTSLTITVSGVITNEGIGNATTDAGAASGARVETLNISGPGSLFLPTGSWSFECGNYSSSDNINMNVAINGTGGIVQHNSGTLSLNGTNTYSGGTSATGGQIIQYNNNASFGTGAISTSGGGTSFLNTSGSLVTLPNAFNINSGTSVVNFGQGNVTSTGAWTLGVTPQLKNNAGNDTVTISGPISGAFGMDMLCDNTGAQITLSGANTYTGVTSIGLNGAGATTIVNVSSINSVTTPAQQASSSLGKPSSVANGTIALGSSTIAGQLVYTGAGETSDRVINLLGTTGGGIIEMDGAGPLVLTSAFTATGAGAKTLTLQGSSTAANTIGGAIVNSSSATSLTKAGVGNWTLSGVSTFTGGTTISAGTLTIGGAGSLGSGSYAGTIANSGTFVYDSSAKQTLTGVVSGAGSIVVSNGLLVFSGNANTFSNSSGIAITIYGGTVQTGGDQTSGAKAANLGETPSSFVPNNIVLAGGTLQGNNPNFAFMPNRGITLLANSGLSAITNGNDLIPTQGELGIQGIITDNNAGYGITITGETNLTTGLLSGVYLEAVNTYTGPTVVASGILSLFGNGSINNSSSITIASGAVLDLSSNTANPWNLVQPLAANGTGVGLPGFYTTAPTAAALLVGGNGGTINFNAENLNLTITPTNFNGDGNQPALFVTQGTVVLNGNSVSVTNNGASPLGYGTYTLMQQASGSISVSSAPTLAGGVVAGNGTVANATLSLAVSGGALNLIVAPSAGNATAPYFSNLAPPTPFTYGSASSITVSGTVSNLSGGIAVGGDTITAQVGSLGAQTATIGANGNFSITYTFANAFTPAGSYPITYSYSGGLGSATDTSTSLQISQALLSVSASNPSRNYNGTTAANVTLTANTLNSDVVTVSGTPAPFGSTNFASANPGTGITVTITGLYLSGAQAGNYYLGSSTYTLTANILTPVFTWDGLDSVTNANFTWGDQFNWSNNVAPDLIGDSPDFTGTTGLVPVMQASYTNWSLLFDGSAGAFVMTNSGGSILSMGAGGISNASANTQIIAVPVANITTFSSQWYVTNGSSLLMNSNVSDAGGGITLNGGGTLDLSGSNNAITGPLTNLAGTLIFTGGTKLNNESYAGAINNNGTFNFNSTSNQTLSGVISGSGTMILGGTGTLTLSGANTYTGQTIVSNGSLAITKDSNLGNPPLTPVANQLVLNNFINNGANDYGLRDSATFTLNANRGIYLGPLGGSINVANTFTLTVAGIISGPGSFYASPNDSAGFGTILLTANNTYQGATFIGCGVLELGVNGALPAGTPLTVNQAASTVAATLNMNSFSQTIGPLASAQFGGTGTLLPTIDLTGALTVYQTNVTTTFGGAMTGAGGSLTVTVPLGGTPGTLILTGTNTYTGSTTISAATLALSTKGSISNSASISIAAGGTFDVSALTSSTFNLSASTLLSAAGTGTGLGTTAADINGASAGTVNLGARPISLTFTPSAFTGDTTHPALNVSQGTLQLNNNTISVNNAGAHALGAGTYTLIQQATGSVSGTPNPVVTVTGNGTVAGSSNSIAVSGGSVNLIVTLLVPPTPVINSFVNSSGNLVLSGTNGPANGTYIVLSSTNVALPLASWTPVSTNTFSPTGAFSVTNAISGSQSFFAIQVPY